MNSSEEIKYARETLGLKTRDSFETLVGTNLRGAGFESWHGIAALTPTCLVLSSAPGIFSMGLSRMVRFEDMISFSPTESRASISFLISGQLTVINFVYPESAPPKDWHRFIFMLQLRIAGIPPAGSGWPFDLVFALETSTALNALKLMQEMPSRVHEHQLYRNWKAFCLMVTGGIPEALTILMHPSIQVSPAANENPSHSPDPDYNDNLLRKRLLGECFLFSGYSGKAEQCFLSIPDWQTNNYLKTLVGISLAKQDRWEAVPLLENLPRPRFFSFKSGKSSGNELILFFAATSILSFPAYPDLQSAWQSSLFSFLCSWGCLKSNDITGAEKFLELAKKSGKADVIELVRIEAAIAFCEGNIEKSFHLLFVTGSKIFLAPLLELGLKAGKENELSGFIKKLKPGEFPPGTLTSAIGVLSGAKEWESAKNFLAFLEKEKICLSHIEELRIRLWKCLIMLNTNWRDRLNAEFESLEKCLSVDSNHPGRGTFPIFLDAGFSEIREKAQLIGAELDINSGNPDSALTRLAACEKYLARKGGKDESEQAKRLLEKAQEMISRDNSEKGGDRPEKNALTAKDNGKSLMIRNLESLAAIINHQPLLSGFSREIVEIRHAAEDPLLAVVLGEFKAGKSTLLNAWLGSELLPTGVRPTTCLPCLLRHGSKPSARIVYASGRDETVLPENLRRYVDEFSPEKNNGGKPRNTELDVSHVEIFLSIPQLSEVWFVDTPGLNSQFSSHNRYTEKFAARGDAYIWVLDATQLGRESEFSAFGRMIPRGKKVIAVLNRIDEVNADEIPDLVSEASRLMQIPEGDVVPVSARNALLSRQDTKIPLSPENKFDEFSRLLNIELFEHAWPVKSSSLKQGIHKLFSDILISKEKETRELDELQESLRGSREDLSQKFAEWTSISFPALTDEAFVSVNEKMREMANFAHDADVFPDQPDNHRDMLFRVALLETGRKIQKHFREWFNGLVDGIFPVWRKTRVKISSPELFVNSGVIEGAIISRIHSLPNIFSLPENKDLIESDPAIDTGNKSRSYEIFLETILFNWKIGFIREAQELESLMIQGNYYFEDRLAEYSAHLRFSAYDPVIRMQKLFQ